MLVGIDIKVRAIFTDCIFRIFNNAITDEYEWEIISDQIDVENNIDQGLFNGNRLLNNIEFFECISNRNYHMVFVDIKVYPINSNHSLIKSFTDFIKSSCEFIFLCTDSSFIEIYCKNQSILHKIIDNCKHMDDVLTVDYVYKDDAMNRTMIAW